VEKVAQTHALRLVPHRRSPDPRVLELVAKRLVNTIAKVPHGGVRLTENDWGIVVWDLALGLGVDTGQTQLVPHHLQQLVKVPPVLGGDGHTVVMLVCAKSNTQINVLVGGLIY